ncbi:MAG: ATP-binding protein [Desulfobacteraceae bacterium]
MITGAPCSGKTAVIRMLEQRGHKVIHEVARAYIDNELMKGKALTEIKTDEWSFERHILMEKVRIEARLKKDEIIFFDRGVPDSIAYYKLNGLNTAEPFQKSLEVRYQNVFHFERLRFLADPVRSENEQTARLLNRLITESYRSVGYDIIHVPLLSVEERTEFVLAHL